MALTQIKSSNITDGTIVNADVSASAAIASTKLSGVESGFSDMKFKTASETYTVPTGITKIVIDLISGGGGGGGGSGPYYSSGGSAGSNAIKTLTVSVGQTYTLVVGAAGAAGATGASGGDGGTSSFVNASGTTVNLQCTGGGGGTYNSVAGAGGSSTGGDLNIDGAGKNSNAGAGQSAYVAGSTRWGFPSFREANSASAAQPGVGYGAGGCAAAATTSAVGAAGRPGLCVITEYK